jgi:raffinose/stachyose/melibiose transport system substrate-binding protein
MRKYAWLSVVLLVAFVVSACGGGAGRAPPAPAAPAQSQPTTAPAAPAGAKTKLVIESWRNDDRRSGRQDHSGVQPEVSRHRSGVPATARLNKRRAEHKLEGGTAGDLITCRPFDNSLGLFQKGYLAPLTDLAGMANFSDVAKSAWITDDGKTPFCVPMASVIHGFIYNKEAFDKLGLKPPATKEEFMQVLDKIKADGTYAPLAMGTADQWEAATMGFQNIGPNNWKGEDGRLGLIKGTEKYTDPQYVKTWQELADWAPYLPSGFEAVKYPDSQSLFTLGKAAIYPAGSWEISQFNKDAKFPMGVFLPPVDKAGDPCYISDHTDIALGMNAKTKNPDAAKKFLDWVASPEFAEICAMRCPAFSLQDAKIAMKDPLAQEFISWRDKCKSTIRNSYQILSRGEPNLENELWAVSANVINGKQTPEEAAKQLQDGLDKWYKPQ